MVDRNTEGVYLPLAVANEIWADAQDQSFVMQHVPSTPLPGQGKTFQTITGDPQAGFVNEGARKPGGEHTFGTKNMRAYKIALYESFTDEFVRDKARLYAALRPRLSKSLGITFDQAALHGIGAPTADFDNLADAPTVDLVDPIYDQFVAGLQSVSLNRGDLSAFAFSGQAEASVLLAKDTTGRPLFTSNMQTDGSIGSVLGRPVYRNRSVYDEASSTVAIAGDWSAAMWGSVEGVRYEEYGGPIFDDAGALVHAGRQDNMITIITEFEIGFIVRDINRFVRYTATTGETGA